MVPALLAIGLQPDLEFPEQGKWNRFGYQWRFRFSATSDERFALLIRIASKKSTIFDASLFFLNVPDPGEAASSSTATPDFNDQPSIGIFGTSLSAISEFLFFERLPVDWIPDDWGDRILWRISLVPLAFLWFLLASLVLLLSLPILGYRHRGERSRAVASGVRQRRMVARATAILVRTFRDGVPEKLTRKLLQR